jgi:NADPH-dependent glutamate synthase beta subunit-like oxidoreductase
VGSRVMIHRRWFQLMASCSRPALDFSRAVSVAIVGSGPAGMYTADELLRCSKPPGAIHIFERAPLPFGLLRYGVAPDHPEVRLVEHKFHNEVLDESSVRLFGCVEIGRDVSLAQLCQSYDAVFLCHGACRSKWLPLPVVQNDHTSSEPAKYGDQGYFSSQQVVGWYNCELSMAGISPPFESAKSVVIIGAGNVALDIARVLVKPASLLAETNIARLALQKLQHSSVHQVTIVARRGAVHAAFATKELREISQLPNVDITIDEKELAHAVAEVETQERPVKRLVKLLQDVAMRPSRGPQAKRLRFAFERTPTALLRDSGLLKGLRTDKEDIEADVVVASVGYEAETPDASLAPLAASGTKLQNNKGRIRKGL